MKKHIFERERVNRNVIIFGKGPSFDPRLGISCGLTGSSTIIAVNQTAIALMNHMVFPNLVVCNDIEPVNDIMEFLSSMEFKTNSMDIAVPVYPHFNEKGPEPYEDPMTHGHIRGFREVYYFDLWTGVKQEFPKWPVFCVPNSYITALTIAVRLGAKNVFTSGIDGGDVRHETFAGTKKVNPNDYMNQFPAEEKIAKENNIIITRVYDGWSRYVEVHRPDGSSYNSVS